MNSPDKIYLHPNAEAPLYKLDDSDIPYLNAEKVREVMWEEYVRDKSKNPIWGLVDVEKCKANYYQWFNEKFDL